MKPWVSMAVTTTPGAAAFLRPPTTFPPAAHEPHNHRGRPAGRPRHNSSAGAGRLAVVRRVHRRLVERAAVVRRLLALAVAPADAHRRGRLRGLDDGEHDVAVVAL